MATIYKCMDRGPGRREKIEVGVNKEPPKVNNKAAVSAYSPAYPQNYPC